MAAHRAHRGLRALIHQAWVTAAVIALALVGCVAGTSAVSSAGAAVSQARPLKWVDCGKGFQCTRLAVPLDYAKPSGTKIEIALTKHPATSRHGRGSVVVNAGTQNGGGSGFVQGFPQATAAINRNFDVVGLDTRGVGNSQPLVHCVTYAEERKIEAPLSAAQTVADRRQRVKEATGLTSKCQQRSAALLPYLSSTTSARDLDRVRSALGEERLRLVAVSGGSVLADSYLKLFPNRIAALVLDSPFNADQFTNHAFDFDIDQMVATEGTMGTFFDWCRSTPSQCSFGKGDPRGAFERLLAKTGKNRLAYPGRWDVMTDGSLVDLVAGAMIFPDQWPQLGQQLAKMASQAVPKAPLLKGEDRGFAEYYSQTCLDRSFPNSLASFDQQLHRSKQAAPLIGGRFGYAEFKCRQWPTGPAERISGHPGSTNSQGSPVLVLTADDDPLAPHSGAIRTAFQLHGSIVDVRGSGSIQLGRTPCLGSAVSTFLQTGSAVPYSTCSVPLPGH